jgi:hypothetical protein
MQCIQKLSGDVDQEIAQRGRLYSDSAIVSTDFSDMPIIDLDLYLKVQQCDDPSKLPDEVRIECQKVAECFHNFGILLIKDPRVNMQDNEAYIDMMEDYFEKTGNKFYAGEPIADIKPECHYQVGATPEFVE